MDCASFRVHTRFRRVLFAHIAAASSGPAVEVVRHCATLRDVGDAQGLVLTMGRGSATPSLFGNGDPARDLFRALSVLQLLAVFGFILFWAKLGLFSPIQP